MTRALRPPALRGRREPRLRRLPGLLADRRRGPGAGCRASSTCSPASRHWAGDGGRPFLPRAISVAETGPADGRRPARLPDRRGRPRHRPPLRAGRGRGGLGHRAARQRLLDAARGQRRARPGRSWSAAASASPRWRLLRRRFSERGVPLRVLLGFRDAGSTPAASSSSAATAASSARGAPRLRGRPRRPPRLRHRPAGSDAGRRRRRLGRRLLLRPAGDAGGGPAALRRARRRLPSWRWSRRWPAASAPASAARSRSPTAATCGSASTARSVRG